MSKRVATRMAVLCREPATVALVPALFTGGIIGQSASDASQQFTKFIQRRKNWEVLFCVLCGVTIGITVGVAFHDEFVGAIDSVKQKLGFNDDGGSGGRFSRKKSK